MDLGLAELVQIPEELQHVGPTAPGQRQWGPVVAEVLAERVPVPPLLRLIPARPLLLVTTPTAGRTDWAAGGVGGAGDCHHHFFLMN